MLLVVFFCTLLITLTTLIHYEVLRALSARLPSLNILNRTKVLVAVFATFAAHILEIVVYGETLFLLAKYFELGSLKGPTELSMANCLYFSAETYTSLGFGDVMPVGSIRLLAGVEALNGLLLVGWSASYLYIAMERFWIVGGKDPHR
ncbi:MAG: two pore domain potassium channel family protein [Methylobacter sp.]|nr:MAG: two pore domain potassium channel family protein [Methylobacter sp.]